MRTSTARCIRTRAKPTLTLPRQFRSLLAADIRQNYVTSLVRDAPVTILSVNCLQLFNAWLILHTDDSMSDML